MWGAFQDGIEIYSKDVDFASGIGVTNGERDNTGDTAYSHFSDIEEYHPGNEWTNFEDVRRFYDNDPGFYLSRISANAHKVLKE